MVRNFSRFSGTLCLSKSWETSRSLAGKVETNSYCRRRAAQSSTGAEAMYWETGWSELVGFENSQRIASSGRRP